MSTAGSIQSLVGASTRYIAGRNAMQTVYWRTLPGPNGKMLKYNKTCSFDRNQKMPNSLRIQYYNRTFKQAMEQL